MLFRNDPHGLTVITQPAHAWVSGQLARAWGNERFGPVVPWEEVCLAAEQHDVGWLAWEAAPTLNRQTGRPYTFLELPLEAHLAIWSAAGPLALAWGRYPALLVSLHGTGLYQQRDLAKDAPADAGRVRDFLARQYAWQEEVKAALRNDPQAAPHAAPDLLARNRRLLAVWDYLSLLLCMGLRAEHTLDHVPTAGGAAALTLAPVAGDPTEVRLAPWPFGPDRVSLVCEGRRLLETYTDEEAMRAGLAGAARLTITTRLRPG
jgi:hypothetical protein